jgi:hypothetical protein
LSWLGEGARIRTWQFFTVSSSILWKKKGLVLKFVLSGKSAKKRTILSEKPFFHMGSCFFIRKSQQFQTASFAWLTYHCGIPRA